MQIRDIKALEESHDVCITINQGVKSSIEIRGRSENVFHVIAEIRSIFREVEKSKEMHVFATKVIFYQYILQ